MAQKLSNHKIQSLINASGINNIPSLKISTTNPIVNRANECGYGVVYVGDLGSDDSCKITCASTRAKAIFVHPDDTYIFDSVVLKPGVYCTMSDRPQCNTNMTYVIMTLNTVLCKSKFPELVGGELGNNILACNNNQIADPQNYLWDNEHMRKFDPFRTVLTDVDEKLSDNNYRFTCKFKGTDTMKNLYIENPNNRFHPIRNYCASEILHADTNKIKTKFKSDGSYTCECNSDRIDNIDPNDKTSLCSHFQVSIKKDKSNRKILSLPYKCFNLFSTISDVGQYLPCEDFSQFTKDGNRFDIVKIPFSEDINKLIEHPLYGDELIANATVYMPAKEIDVDEVKIDYN